jgi:LPS-assembly lipoprotein
MNAAPANATTGATAAMSRRSALRCWMAVAAVLPLGACGFRLRGAQKLAFQVLRMQGSTNTPVAQELRAALIGAGVQVLGAVKPAAETPVVRPQVILTVQRDQRERAVVGQTAAGQVRELQLRTRFQFSLATPAGQYVLEDTELLLERDISYTETAALAKEAEEALLYRDMQSDIVQQVMRRLVAIRSL